MPRLGRLMVWCWPKHVTYVWVHSTQRMMDLRKVSNRIALPSLTLQLVLIFNESKTTHGTIVTIIVFKLIGRYFLNQNTGLLHLLLNKFSCGRASFLRRGVVFGFLF